MGRQKIDHTNIRYGRWTGITEVAKPEGGGMGAYWLFKCDCGAKKVLRGASVKSKGGSCGCLKSELASKQMAKLRKSQSGTISDRFMSRYSVSQCGCWEWTSNRDRDGYGYLSSNTGSIRAHRFSYEHHKNPIPAGYVIRHKCDNRGCVNPDHLEIGLPSDNVLDCLKRGRDKMVGDRNNNSKLTWEDVEAIRSCKDSSIFLAEKYKVSKSTINRIRSGRSWKGRNWSEYNKVIE